MSCTAVLYTACSLAAAYRGDHTQAERRIWKVLKDLKKAVDKEEHDEAQIQSILRIIQLMIHYQVVTPQQFTKWSFHARDVAIIQQSHSINYEPSLFITYESILKLSYHTDDGRGGEPNDGGGNPYHGSGIPNDGINIGYLLECASPDKILDFGCSRRLLHLLGSINVCESETRDEDQLHKRFHAGNEILSECEIINQVAPEEDEYRKSLIEKTAETYRLVAQIMVYSRLFGYDHIAYLSDSS